ncbi:hypothetical protein GCM10010112_51060 [Actinoplanes lobatus]|uniref:Uncharacterized protein n=3 Tax=Actinoplanes TaxID=1865 RepID=A0A7W5FCU1_9ACTN|nr:MULTISPECIES: hypothetical protein [Actinoplanes]MBB3093595.1 hypothetical protein [Actinoplanes campanulatus]MBB4749513.1 hypothetical protein [Actinoplanes lobatus]MBW6434058.1 hypothetical protein [Actinoplanes hulinensis]GGN04392.1 hypothetical protein GCM10010109_11140 [Actinoplanes campanulatus]GGN77756.1 hypothetical protein GCM10010112_51060 [Actinoplanes lobatus]
MATDMLNQPMNFAAVSRVLVSVAAEVATGVQRAVVGSDNVRTARDNAWDAIQADRARAAARAETARAVAAMIATRPASRPRRARSLAV